jgi:signal transduction histidine kinase
LSLGIVALFGGTVGFLLIDYIENYGLVTNLFTYVFFAAIFVLAILTEWLGSLVRQGKCGESIFKNSVIYKLFRVIFKACKKLFKMFKYKPKAFKIQVIFLFIAYAFINLGLMLLCHYLLVLIPVVPVFNIAVVYCLARYVKNLDKIIVASGEGKNVVFEDKRKVANSLLTLADNLSNSNAQLEKAVAEAVKKEQMKTQLITNVSHDIKTPLTSIINYSDLISSEECENENIKEYAKVLHNQSERMKRLIEDLVEASKASSGNIEIVLGKCDAGVMISQMSGEYEQRLSEAGLELVCTAPENDIYIMADGRRIWRVFDNLMGNARKYALRGTRVYVSLEAVGNNAVFTFKNISREPLALDASELTERFVRGDKSRNTEGNGLGLSIAKSLIELQGGEFNITVDGDLFKVTLSFPRERE